MIRHFSGWLALTGLILLGYAYLARHSVNVVQAMPVGTTEMILPRDDRDWRLISVAHKESNINDLRAVLGNDVAVRAYRGGSQPFSEGAAIARLAWAYTPSKENNQAFGREQSFVAGTPINIQLMAPQPRSTTTYLLGTPRSVGPLGE